MIGLEPHQTLALVNVDLPVRSGQDAEGRDLEILFVQLRDLSARRIDLQGASLEEGRVGATQAGPRFDDVDRPVAVDGHGSRRRQVPRQDLDLVAVR